MPSLSINRLIVTPVVAFLEDPAVIDTLQPAEGEVSRIFTIPLEATLDPSILKALNEPLAEKGSKDWEYEEDFFVRRSSSSSVSNSQLRRVSLR